MKKNLLKSSIVTWSLLAFGFLMLSWSNTANTVNAQEASWSGEAAEVVLTITQWDLTIGISWVDNNVINLWAVTVSNDTGYVAGAFGADSFWLSDQKWIESGYYTTLSVTDLVWSGNAAHVIWKEHVFLKTSGVTTITWVNAATAGVTIWLTGEWSGQSMSTAVTYFTRPTNSGAWMLWVYGDNLQITVEIPAHTLADTYKGTITYTLYDGKQPSPAQAP